MIIDISNKVAVITGSSKGIGSELARAFAKENANVVINYCHSKKLAEKLFDEIKEINSKCILIKADVTKPEDVSAMYHEIMKTFGRIDILINNAGLCDDNLIQMMSLKQWRNVLDVNLTGVFLCCREFSKAMIKQQSGRIINIASLKGQEGSMGQINYSTSKAGVIGFTKALAKELGKYNISVNTVCPGFIITDLNKHNREKIETAEKRSILSPNSTLNDLVWFLIYMSSEMFLSTSGRVFNLDSRLN